MSCGILCAVSFDLFWTCTNTSMSWIYRTWLTMTRCTRGQTESRSGQHRIAESDERREAHVGSGGPGCGKGEG